MAFTPKDWKQAPDPTTPINALALEDMEQRLGAYTDTQVAPLTSSVGTNTSSITAITNTYKVVRTVGVSIPAATVAGTYALNELIGSATGMTLTSVWVYFDPADYAVSGKTTKLRVQVTTIVGIAAPAANFTIGLYPTTSISAGAAVVGTVIAGSTLAVNAPALNTLQNGTSGDFTAPAAGYYALGVVVSATTAASSSTLLRAQLHVRTV